MKNLCVVFDGPPGPEAGRFVECEDGEGRSLDAGEWRERPDGLWELVVDPDLLAPPSTEWAIVEVMGHDTYAGQIREVPLVGDVVGLEVRCPDVEVPPYVNSDGMVPGYTGRGFDKTFSPKAVFSIELVSEDIARARAWSLGHYERQRPAAQPRPPIKAGMVVIPSFDPEGAAAVIRVDGEVLFFGAHEEEWTYRADGTLAIYSAAGELLWGLGPDAPPDRQPCFDIPF